MQFVTHITSIMHRNVFWWSFCNCCGAFRYNFFSLFPCISLSLSISVGFSHPGQPDRTTTAIAPSSYLTAQQTLTLRLTSGTCWALRFASPFSCSFSWFGSLTVNLKSVIVCIIMAMWRLINIASRSRT